MQGVCVGEAEVVGQDRSNGRDRRAEDEGKTALLLGRRVEGMADQVVARVNN